MREIRRFIVGLPWLALLTACLPVLVVTARAAGEAGEPLTVAGDYALLELGTRSALHLDQLLGPYSRYLWNHPGPAMFVIVAPFYGLTGTEPGGMGLGAAVWNLAVVAAIVILAYVAGGRRWAWATAVTVVAWTFAYGPEQLADPWNPTMTVLPTAAVVVAAAAFVAGQRWALPVLVVLGTMAVQTHVGTAVVVTAVTGVAVSVGTVRLVRGQGWRSLRRPVLVTLGVLVVAWAPPVWEQLTHDPGNLGELVAFARDDDAVPLHELGESVESATELVVGVHRPVGRVVRETGPASPLPDLSAAEWSFAFLLALGLVAAVVAGAVRRRWFGVVAAGLAAVAWLAAVVSAGSARGELYLYVLAFVSGVGLAVWIAVIGNLAAALPRSIIGRVGRWAPTVAVALSVLVSFDAARGPLALDRYANPRLEPLVNAAVAAVETDGAHVVRLRILHDSEWPAAAAIAAAVEDNGVDVNVETPWTFMFGDERSPTGDEGYLLSVGRRDDPRPTADDEVLAVLDQTVLYGASELHPGPSAPPAPPG